MYEARPDSPNVGGWYVFGPELPYLRFPHRDLATAFAHLLNKQAKPAADAIELWLAKE